MSNTCCDNWVEYKKSNPMEFIDIGDVIMLDIDEHTITRAVAKTFEEKLINSRLIIGVCVDSNNEFPPIGLIHGGNSKDIIRETLDGGYSINGIQTIVIHGGSSEINKREVIKVAYSGEQLVNICGYVDLGDKLCISSHPGKVRSKEYVDDTYFDLRTIGKVIKYTNNKNKVKVLLDIE